MFQGFQGGQFSVVLLDGVVVLHGLADVACDLSRDLRAYLRITDGFVIACTRQS